MKKFLILALAVAPSVHAQMMVPPIERTASAAPVVYTAEPSAPIQLTSREEAALKIAREWKNNSDKPRRAADGTVVYPYGVTLPTLICTPLQVCAIRLQPGEIVNGVHAGDSARWRIDPSMIGTGPNATTNVIVKPTDSGLTTNVIITTDRRSYTIQLKSARIDWMPAIAFDYPDDQERAWANYRAGQAKVEHASTLPTGENVAALDFGYAITGDNPPWRPVRVYKSASGKTYVQFASSHFVGGEAPALVVIGKDGGMFSDATHQIINYRLVGDRYVVDGIPPRFALISGVGKEQTRVMIEYIGVNPK